MKARPGGTGYVRPTTRRGRAKEAISDAYDGGIAEGLGVTAAGAFMLAPFALGAKELVEWLGDDDEPQYTRNK